MHLDRMSKPRSFGFVRRNQRRACPLRIKFPRVPCKHGTSHGDRQEPIFLGD